MSELTFTKTLCIDVIPDIPEWLIPEFLEVLVEEDVLEDLDRGSDQIILTLPRSLSLPSQLYTVQDIGSHGWTVQQ